MGDNGIVNVEVRANPKDMTDREIQEEMLHRLRAFSDAMEAISNNPMLKAMMPGV